MDDRKLEIKMDRSKTTENMVVFKSPVLAEVSSVYVHKSFAKDLEHILVTIEPA